MGEIGTFTALERRLVSSPPIKIAAHDEKAK